MVQGLATVWAPRADGVFLKAPPQHLVLTGSVAQIPFMTGMYSRDLFPHMLTLGRR